MPDIRIPFPLERGRSGDLLEREEFWDSPATIHWFEERGYTLYSRYVDEYGYRTCGTVPSLPETDFVQGVYPYASHDTMTIDKYTVPLRGYQDTGKLAFAQDRLHRHVAIKIVRDGTDEYRIMRFLLEQSQETLREHCIIPVLDLLPIDGFWFAVMPRWGRTARFEDATRVCDVLDTVHAMLKALAFLHKHNISHGDIKLANMVVNHFGDDLRPDSPVRKDLQQRRSLTFAMIDFDFSISLPADADPTTFRLPYHMSWGTFNLTMDTAQGEFDFNPFVLDVGTMGAEFCRAYQHLTGHIPMLAPLLDRMTTRNLSNRFTASEALEFFEETSSEFTEKQLLSAVPIEPDLESELRFYDEYDRWAVVPADLVQRWSSYREPPLPWTTTLLRYVCSQRWLCHVVPWVRRSFYRVYLTYRRIYFNFLGLGFTK